MYSSVPVSCDFAAIVPVCTSVPSSCDLKIVGAKRVRKWNGDT